MKNRRLSSRLQRMLWLSCLLLLPLTVGAAETKFELAPRPIGGTAPKVGDKAPDFTLKTPDGREIKGSALWREKPLLLVTGSHTCPVYRRMATPLEKLAAEFRERVNFVLLYTVEAHRGRIMEKLNLHSIGELVRFAVRNGLID